MKVANRTDKPPTRFTGAVIAVLAIILILTMLGISNSRFVTTAGFFVGLLSIGLAATVWGTLILLANIQDVLKEARAIEADSALAISYSKQAPQEQK